jgi:Cu(I)/Ag(I) efflux system membrane protein CusA/SilA
MKVLKTSRKFHRWLMLFLGLQFLIWSISGAYMVIFDIDYIHGDSLVVNHQTKVDANKLTYPLSLLRQEYPDAQSISVEVFIDQVVYRFCC